jgi:hypothetical protein
MHGRVTKVHLLRTFSMRQAAGSTLRNAWRGLLDVGVTIP